MTRFSKIYENFKVQKPHKESKGEKVNNLSREGYGYIKRRKGLLSYELDGPTYLSIFSSENSKDDSA